MGFTPEIDLASVFANIREARQLRADRAAAKRKRLEEAAAQQFYTAVNAGDEAAAMRASPQLYQQWKVRQEKAKIEEQKALIEHQKAEAAQQAEQQKRAAELQATQAPQLAMLARRATASLKAGDMGDVATTVAIVRDHASRNLIDPAAAAEFEATYGMAPTPDNAQQVQNKFDLQAQLVTKPSDIEAYKAQIQNEVGKTIDQPTADRLIRDYIEKTAQGRGGININMPGGGQLTDANRNETQKKQILLKHRIAGVEKAIQAFQPRFAEIPTKYLEVPMASLKDMFGKASEEDKQLLNELQEFITTHQTAVQSMVLALAGTSFTEGTAERINDVVGNPDKHPPTRVIQAMKMVIEAARAEQAINQEVLDHGVGGAATGVSDNEWNSLAEKKLKGEP